MLLSCRRITGKRNTCTGSLTHITKGHHLYINRSTPRIRNIVVAAIYVGTRVVPRTEYCLDRFHQLYFRIGREIFPDLFFVLGFKLIGQLFQIISRQFYVLDHAFFFFHLINQFFEIFLSDFHNHVGEHLDKSAVAIPCPTGIP